MRREGERQIGEDNSGIIPTSSMLKPKNRIGIVY